MVRGKRTIDLPKVVFLCAPKRETNERQTNVDLEKVKGRLLTVLQLKIRLPSLHVGPPTITLNPVSQTVAKGASAVLTCNASSSLQVKITWFKNGQPIGFGSRLQIDSFQNDSQGIYYCKFSTDVTSSFSKPALLVMKGLFYDVQWPIWDTNIIFFNSNLQLKCFTTKIRVV